MIKIIYSFSVENLIEKLLNDIESIPESSDPFYSPKIIIPNNNLSKYINLENAKKRSISFNFNFDYLENVLMELLLSLSGEHKKNIELLTSKKNHIILTYMINNIIHSDFNNKELSEIKKFIGNASEKEKNKKIWQLSQKLSSLFREYQYKRKFIIEKWLDYKKAYPSIKSEEFQMYIYYKIFNKKNGMFINEINNCRYTTLLDIFDEISKIDKKNIKIVNKKIHIFCLSNISNFHYVLLNFLSDFFDFNIYLLNYSGNFKNKTFLNFVKFNIKDENYKQIKTFLTNYTSEELFYENKKADTLLKIIKNRLLSEGTNNLNEMIYKKESNPEDDGSIRIAGCQGIYREVETVLNSIIYNLKTIPGLKLNDIAVLVPNLNKYKPYFNYILAKNSKLSFNLIDSTAKEDSIYGKAILSLIDLINGNFTRKEMFELFYNPCFMNKFKLSYNDINIWLELCEENNIYNNLNEDSIFSWEKGLERVSLGTIMEEEKNFDEIFRFNSYYDIIPYNKNNIFDNVVLDKFIFIIQSLKNDVKQLKSYKNDPFTMITKIIKIFDEYLDVDYNNKFEVSIKNSIIDSLHTLINMSNIFNKNDFVTIDLISEEIDSMLESMPSSNRNYLTSGINISQLLPMRPIPFKIIYIMGLNENDFPGKNEDLTINLINNNRMTGDLSKSEINLMLFIEIMFSAKDKLYLTFINKDIEKDAELHPSLVINIMLDFINNEILKDKKMEIIETPLNSESLNFIKTGYTDKYKDIICNFNLHDRICILNKLESYNFKLDDNLKSKINNYSIKFNFFDYEENKKEIPKNIIININELVKFIENPIEQLIKKHLDIYDEDFEDASEKEDEIFFINKLFCYEIYNNIISSSIEDINNLKENFNNYYEYQTLTGNTPENQFGLSEKIKLFDEIISIFNDKNMIVFLKKIQSYENYIEANTEGNKLTFLTINFQEINDFNIELTGGYEQLFKKEDNFELLHITNSKQIKNKYLIKSYLYYMMLLYDNYKINEFNLNIIHSKLDNYLTTIRFDPCDKKFAVNYLKDLINDYLFNNKNFNFMPVDLIDNKLIKTEDAVFFKNEFINKIMDAENNEFNQMKKSNTLKLINNINKFVPDDCYNIFKKRLYPILKNKIN